MKKTAIILLLILLIITLFAVAIAGDFFGKDTKESEAKIDGVSSDEVKRITSSDRLRIEDEQVDPLPTGVERLVGASIAFKRRDCSSIISKDGEIQNFIESMALNLISGGDEEAAMAFLYDTIPNFDRELVAEGYYRKAVQLNNQALNDDKSYQHLIVGMKEYSIARTLLSGVNAFGINPETVREKLKAEGGSTDIENKLKLLTKHPHS